MFQAAEEEYRQKNVEGEKEPALEAAGVCSVLRCTGECPKAFRISRALPGLQLGGCTAFISTAPTSSLDDLLRRCPVIALRSHYVQTPVDCILCRTPLLSPNMLSQSLFLALPPPNPPFPVVGDVIWLLSRCVEVCAPPKGVNSFTLLGPLPSALSFFPGAEVSSRTFGKTRKRI